VIHTVSRALFGPDAGASTDFRMVVLDVDLIVRRDCA